MTFSSPYDHGFARVAAITIPSHPGQPDRNVPEIAEAARKAARQGACVAVFPEMSISGYTLDDLVFSERLLASVEKGIELLAKETSDCAQLIVVGAPLRIAGQIYNCAVFLARGRVVALTPKVFLSSAAYEKRYFTSGSHLAADACWDATQIPGASEAPIGNGTITVEDVPGLAVGAEVGCEGAAAYSLALPLALQGASIIVNPAAYPATLEGGEQQKLLAEATSRRGICAYLHAGAGNGESSSDAAWEGRTFIFQNGSKLAETEPFPSETQIALADIDLALLANRRRRESGFTEAKARQSGKTWEVRIRLGVGVAGAATAFDPWENYLHSGQVEGEEGGVELIPRPVRFPFLPTDQEGIDRACRQAFQIQVYGLQKRLQAVGNPKMVLGVSGGLDSTQAILVCTQVAARLGLEKSQILAYTLPGFATSAGTKSHAFRLCESLGIKCEEIDIRPAARQMLADMDHPFAQGAAQYDVAFENVQAGLRADYLFRIANHQGGLVIGTGDLSEAALGWCTYGVGDHMSHYSVNPGIPKTMLQYMIRWVCRQNLFGEACTQVLQEILAQEISPELIPGGGEKLQSTQDTIGPYELHEFFLFHLLSGRDPRDIAYLAYQAWADKQKGMWPADLPESDRHEYDLKTILRWLREFLHRFFTSQFKRTCVPGGPGITDGFGLSPRGDFRMPSDISGRIWIHQVDELISALQDEK
ncbi:NAD(+) synthase [Varibaculum vaginae]|uniref:NAD(+) synthase n=1 Tax=Varibaculum vaginae TaxID=2364797 RepID=UPI00190F1130|nr:NAD(+) synthase [Varibaculum vaginae]